MHLRLLLAIFLLLSGCSAALPESSKSHSPKKALGTPSFFLEQSYQFSRDLVTPERAILLNFLSRTAAEHHLACTSAWAQENLLLARQLPMDWNRLAIEKNALVALSYVKPRRAMTLLRSMDLPVSDGVGFPEDVRSDAATIIFKNYWDAFKTKGFSDLRSEAMYLGQTGQYPYRAIRGTIADLAAAPPKQPGPLSPAAQSLVLDAYSSYQHGSKFQIEDDDFVEFLKTLRPILPASLFRQGLELAVDRLLDRDRQSDQQTYLAHVQTESGTATFHRRQEKLLFELLPLLRETDPDWAAQIVHRDPTLGQAAGNSGKEITSEGVVNPGGTEPVGEQSYGLEQGRAQAAGELAQTNPEAALLLAQSISNPTLRAVALANIANTIGPSAPSRARALERSIDDSLATLKDGEDRLLALSALVRAAAAAGDVPASREALNKCFALGVELFEEDVDAHPEKSTYATPAYNILDEVIKSAASLEPAIIASKVDQIRNVALKAYLLHSLAELLYIEGKALVVPDQRQTKSKRNPRDRPTVAQE